MCALSGGVSRRQATPNTSHLGRGCWKDHNPSRSSVAITGNEALMRCRQVDSYITIKQHEATSCKYESKTDGCKST